MSLNNESNNTSAFGADNTVNERFNPSANASSGLGAANLPPTSAHMIHRDSEPLPTQKNRSTDYSTDAIERGGLSGSNDHHCGTATETATAGRTGFTTGEVGGKHGEHHGVPIVGGTGDKHSHDHKSSTGLGSDSNHHTSSTTGATGTHSSTTGTTGTHSSSTTGTHHNSTIGTGTGATGHKVGMGDKIIGSAQEMAGKVTSKDSMIEKGHIRKTEGKDAVNQHTV
ncbi:hypothetical protein BDV98DRAFT_586568 [Pterulicium gracile]|uniref:CsbD-like domain-containing protein n=1 Tax=Pterulicium gracile TaxID=1884261 RepID=A0A5C3Q1Y4_9AGAR|nr:hypothetical protein BDV98DRAFT_586568 [Pterula gracilis]